jgi:hypothetical protein
MQKIEDASFPALRSAPNQPDWLELAEYASVAGSAIGTIAAGLSANILYAAAPLTAALSLNLANRQRFEQQMQQKANSAIAEVQASVEGRSRQLQILPGEPAELYTAVSDLQQKLQRLGIGGHRRGTSCRSLPRTPSAGASCRFSGVQHATVGFAAKSPNFGK